MMLNPTIQAFRSMISEPMGPPPSIPTYARTGLDLRNFMIDNDPNYPIYHLTAPEGWMNDPNGVTYDPVDKLYHRFYQYNPNYSEDCMFPRDNFNNGTWANCTPFDFDENDNINPRKWGQAVSRDLAFWEDWPALQADSPYDKESVFSGNCLYDVDGVNNVTCIYTGVQNATPGSLSVGVCATSNDWVAWDKSPCMTSPPSEKSQVNHDSAIYKWGGKWYMLSGGCTYSGGSNIDDGGPCFGNGQLWVGSDDLKTWKYLKPLTKSDVTESYWELPYLIPYDKHNNTLRNDQLDEADRVILLVGESTLNIYYSGTFDTSSSTFLPDGGEFTKMNADTGCSYSYNVHMTDLDDNGASRRVSYAWIRDAVTYYTPAALAGDVPIWESAHTLARVLNIGEGGRLIQTVEQNSVEKLWVGESVVVKSVVISETGEGFLPDLKGDSLDMILVWGADVAELGVTYGLAMRKGDEWQCNVSWNTTSRAVCIQGSAETDRRTCANFESGVAKTDEVRIFLDRSIVEVYYDGDVLTGRCNLPGGIDNEDSLGVDLFSVNGTATMTKLTAHAVGSSYRLI